MEATKSYEHPVNLNKVILDGKTIGKVGIVHPVVNKNIDKKANIVFAEIDIKEFAGVENSSIQYEEPSKFPPMTYDLSLELSPDIFYSQLQECWKNVGTEILKNTKIVDTYDTETIHSMTIRFEFSSNERTLSSAEVQEVMDKIVENLKGINVSLRG